MGVWPIAADKLIAYGDVLLAVFNNTVVAAYDIEGHTRDEDNKVTFTGRESQTWARLVGQSVIPSKHWASRAMRGRSAISTPPWSPTAKSRYRTPPEGHPGRRGWVHLYRGH